MNYIQTCRNLTSLQVVLEQNLLVRLSSIRVAPAIQHAIKMQLWDIRTLPMTPEKVFMAMDEKYKV